MIKFRFCFLFFYNFFYFLFYFIAADMGRWSMKTSDTEETGQSPIGVVANVQDYDNVVDEFVLHSRY